MIVYDPLWRTMEAKGISQYRLIRYCGISAGQINRLKHNCYVSTGTIEKLCLLLDCGIESIMEFKR